MSELNTSRIGYIGLTHLGLVHSICSAEKGSEVIAYDRNKKLVDQLKNGKINVKEPRLSELLISNANHLTFTNKIKEVTICDIIYISSDVPTSSDGSSNTKQIEENLNKLSEIISDKTILVILCQVQPGFTRALKFSKQNLFYQVETLIFGDAVQRALEPERFIIGCDSPQQSLPQIYHNFLLKFHCQIFQMAYESAELAKISINMYLVASVTVTNTLAEICENIGANWEDIVPTLKSDKRIGPHAYLKPGLGVSGGNLERDLHSIISIGSRFGTNTQTIQSFVITSLYTKNWLIKTFKKINLKKNKSSKIAVLGLAYKENTNSTKNSPALLFISKLQKYSVSAHDPVATVSNSMPFVQEETVDNCLKGADILVISTPWSEYKSLDPKKIKTLMRGQIIIDPYQLVNSDIARQYGFTCYSLGK